MRICRRLVRLARISFWGRETKKRLKSIGKEETAVGAFVGARGLLSSFQKKKKEKRKEKVEGIVIFFLSFISSKTVTRKSVKRIEVTPLRDDLKLDGKYGQIFFFVRYFFSFTFPLFI